MADHKTSPDTRQAVDSSSTPRSSDANRTHSDRPRLDNDARTLVSLAAVMTMPSILLWAWENRRQLEQKTDNTTLVWTYIAVGTLGMSSVIVLQGLLAYPVAVLLFRKDAQEYIKESTTSEDKIKDAAHRERRLAMSRRWQYWVFMFVFALVMAGLLEEGLKYLALIAARTYGKVISDRDYITIPVAAAVGFATVENMATAFGAFRNNASKRLLLTIIERTVFGIPGHAMTAALIGVNVLARDSRLEPITTWQVIQQPVLLHALSDFILFAISAYHGNIGWVHPKGRMEIGLTLTCVVGIQLYLASILRGKLYQYGIAL
ncbi:hypothetical protein LTR10_011494 [Elasticomyces elasticus]|uniref:PrsW family intramembrane metalloprotease n=1 Tax=Exophiala sideris TaxID=1016849 RepID=A0ABR0JCX0_9EURO|nr:hypothetical protein LTR10_011494 [Elasticomyces elasticus]KAK5032050.1 hypothetical protein LTS07_004672 [Exophiala sideris]KAK5040978.1 hypothetical protein LTR13_003280 [Exophiala sideris]KAK5061688.1 hypothetical protein LTR69_004870 [Exophiala sideris]KAK5184388.1 hypothetical protein LTR44_003061 [Eurotiomycetes sp. CCFEE 6388]